MLQCVIGYLTSLYLVTITSLPINSQDNLLFGKNATWRLILLNNLHKLSVVTIEKHMQYLHECTRRVSRNDKYKDVFWRTVEILQRACILRQMLFKGSKCTPKVSMAKLIQPMFTQFEFLHNTRSWQCWRWHFCIAFTYKMRKIYL